MSGSRKTAEQKQEDSFKRNYGPKVEITRDSKPVRHELNAVIDHAGKDLAPAGMKYGGSMTIFFYADDMIIKQSIRSIATATNFTGDMAIGLNALRDLLDSAKVDIIKHYTQGRGEPDGQA